MHVFDIVRDSYIHLGNEQTHYYAEQEQYSQQHGASFHGCFTIVITRIQAA